MKYLLILLVLCPFALFSQSFTIEYDVILNTLTRKGKLVKNINSESFYFEVQDEKKTDKQNMNEEGSFTKTIYLGNSKEKKRFQIYKEGDGSLINVDFLKDEKVIYSELFPRMNWKLENDTKTISNYMCNKAVIRFRGRNYIAWFTSDISANIGPWKFNSLPGAILQVYDETKAYSWTAIKIVKNEKEIKLEIEKNLEQLTHQQFVEKNETLKKERSKMMLLKYLQRGADIVERKFNRGRETEFEWEEEKEED